MKGNRHNPIVWALCGLLLLTCMAALWAISGRFVYGSDMTQRPIVALVGWLVFAGAVYLALWALQLRHAPGAPGKPLLGWICCVGLGMRLLLFPSLPMLEDDYHRYLWDGAVTAQGYNPYQIVPRAVQENDADIAPALLELGAASGLVLDRVNHPHLSTVYPPVAEAAFALAHWIRPWSRTALKAIYLVCDLAVLALLWAMLQRMALPESWLALYWWNPLFVKETYNSLHMDVLLLPFLMAALALVMARRYRPAMVALAAAVATKLWPVLLAPLLLAPLRRRPWHAVIAGALFAGCCAVLLLPMFSALQYQDDSGLAAYGQRWEMNDALYMLFPWTAGHVLSWLGDAPPPELPQLLGRLIAMALVLGVVVWISLRRSREPRAMAGSALAIAATLFLVSPTQFPWYFAWMLPLLALRPRTSLLLLTVMLPLYYLKFYFDARGQPAFFHYRIVWLEYAPVWTLLLLEAWRARNETSGTRDEA